jgi:methyl-galactoside transport system ATP-binding protein
MENIEKRFPGVLALDGAGLVLEAGSVHALMGENGAGKSTLMKCLFGVYEMDRGEIYLDGKKTSFKNPKEALLGGVAMVHQELNQALKLSVADNLWLGRFPKAVKWLPFVDEGEMRRKTRELLERLKIDVSPDTKMEKLSVSKRQMVEIAKAVSYGARVIVFDEPTSSLTENEAERLFAIIDMLKKQGTGIIYISHKMNEILRICDKVTVMRDGKHIKTSPSTEMTTEGIIRLMVGRELDERFPERKSTPGDVMLEVKDLAAEYTRLKSASFVLRRGEVLGVAGLDGSGRTELVECIFGLSKKRRGDIIVEGKKIKISSPKEAKDAGFALITEERRRDGIFGALSIKENVTLSNLAQYRSFLFLKEKKMSRDTQRSIKSMRIKTPSDKTKIRSLSGGNQQKVILSRWLLTKPKILMLDEPTRGIDIGAKYEIYQIINSLVEAGLGVIMVSSEMSELIGLSDRIIVMSDGVVAGEIKAEEATQEKIMAIAARYA